MLCYPTEFTTRSNLATLGGRVATGPVLGSQLLPRPEPDDLMETTR